MTSLSTTKNLHLQVLVFGYYVTFQFGYFLLKIKAQRLRTNVKEL